MGHNNLLRLSRSVTELVIPLLCCLPLLADAGSYWAANTVTNTSGLAAPTIAAPYTCVTNYYIATNGSDSNNGTSAGAPWLTVGHAVAVLVGQGGTHGGACVNVAPGTYIESVRTTGATSGLSGTTDAPTGYLVFRSSTPHGAIIQDPDADTTYGSFWLEGAHFVIIDGFELAGHHTPGSSAGGLQVGAFGNPCDHIKILNTVSHDHGGPGISAVHTDYLVVQGNLVYGNANTSTYEVSGITTWQAVASDTAAGFHNIISHNIVFNNAEISDGRSQHSDGNGIIIDDFRNTQNGSLFGVYAQQTLIENNLVFANGGGGIRVYSSDGVMIRNNTAFGNYLDNLNQGTWRGDISVQDAANTTVVNNIAAANPVVNANNHGYVDASTNSSNINNLWWNNLSFNGTAGQASILITGSASTIDATHNNQLGLDPLFANPPNANFNLQRASPATGAGTNAYGTPSVDLNGMSWTLPLGLGAYQSRVSSPPAPPTNLTVVVR